MLVVCFVCRTPQGTAEYPERLPARIVPYTNLIGTCVARFPFVIGAEKTAIGTLFLGNPIHVIWEILPKSHMSHLK